MKKNIIVHGLIAGAIASSFMLFLAMNMSDPENGMIVGYASMLLAFSLVFVATKNYRDKYNGGIISFGKAFKIGIMIVLIASTLYVISWLINYFFFNPDCMADYSAYMIEELKNSGASQAQIDAQIKEMADFMVMYNNPFFNALITYTEILPVGLIVTLISSLILKRKTAKAST